MWLSYIIPLYNCERWIGECLDSLLRQGLAPEDYEVIVVNDGSTDGGPAVVERYCRDYGNFRLVHQENQGTWAARNRGLDEARGEYICFVDHDDWLADGGLALLRQMMARIAPSPLDMLVFQYHKGRDYEPCAVSGEGRVIFAGTLADVESDKADVWGRLFRRAMIEERRLRFKPYYAVDDGVFMVDMFTTCPDVTVVETDLDIYCWRIHRGSIMHKKTSENSLMLCDIKISLVKLLQQHRAQCPKQKRFFDTHINFGLWDIAHKLLSSPQPYRTIRERCHRAIAEGVFQKQDIVNLPMRFFYFLVRHPLLLKIASYPKRYVYDPYIRKHIFEDELSV